MPAAPYDEWVSPDGECLAQFYRIFGGFLVRFPGKADFVIDHNALAGSPSPVLCWPVPGIDDEDLGLIYSHSIQPILGNHRGGLFLHGSAVLIGDHAVAFLGQSRSGKTTLAGNFAHEGCPLMSEDVIEVKPGKQGYWVKPNSTSLRLFSDSARFLFGLDHLPQGSEGKASFGDAYELQFANKPALLRAVFVLGSDHQSPLHIKELNGQSRLASLIPNSFILDVDDSLRLRGHFERLADLAQAVPCLSLDYTRDFIELPAVLNRIMQTCEALTSDDYGQ